VIENYLLPSIHLISLAELYYVLNVVGTTVTKSLC
jgi:hypothetical protein